MGDINENLSVCNELYEDTKIPEFVDGYIDTSIGKIRKIKTTITRKDIIGGYKVRWGINRYNYKVSPGIYAIGNPNDKSPVLVTSNYKLTFDILRKSLDGENLWIIVLDTNGINVWCAAGKGTFGTNELLKRLNKVKLKKIISHNKIILPQLGAVGVSAPMVAKAGFSIIYGPVRAEDIPEFIKNGYKSTKIMRKVNFNFKDRIILTPMEMIPDIKYILPIFFVMLILNLLNPQGTSLIEALKTSALNFIPYIGLLLVNACLVPIFLPYIPFRPFALKGFVFSLVWALISIRYGSIFLYPKSILISIANLLLMVSIGSYISLQFTGSSTFTSLSGTRKETLYTILIGGIASIIAIILLIIYKVYQFQ